MEKQYLLIDGKNLLFRAGYANPNLKTSDGRYSGALHGFLRMLHRLRLQFPLADFIVLWEQQGQSTYRHKLFPGYKDRSGKPNSQELLTNGINNQIEAIRQFCASIGMKWVQVPGLEADDLAGLLGVGLTILGHTVVLHSGDCDWWQLACVCGISVLSEQGSGRGDSEFVTDERVQEKFGCKAKELTRLRPFVGDTSDKIPPIKPRFMKKHALQLVRLGVDPRKSWDEQPDEVKAWPELEQLWGNYVRNYKLMKIARSVDEAHLKAGVAIGMLQYATGEPLERHYRDMVQVLTDWELNSALSERSFFFALASPML